MLTGEVIIEMDLEKQPRIIQWIKKLIRMITGRITGRAVTDLNDTGVEVVLENSDNYVIEYETSAPTAVESEISGGKKIVISGPDEVEYTDVIAFTELNNSVSVLDSGQIKIYWHNYDAAPEEVKRVSEVEEKDVVEDIIIDENGEVSDASEENLNLISGNVIQNSYEENKKKEAFDVASKVQHISTDYNNYDDYNYINISIKEDVMDIKTNGRNNVLIVDDTLENIKVLGTILMEEGFIVSVAQSGKEAIEIINKKLPNIILLDISMKEMDGIETCNRIKNDPSKKSIPIIFLTAHTELEYKKKAFSAGGVDYITKPFQKEEVLARVKTHLEMEAYRNYLIDKTATYIPVVQSNKIPDEIKELLGKLADSIILTNNTLYKKAKNTGLSRWISVDQNREPEVQKYFISII